MRNFNPLVVAYYDERKEREYQEKLRQSQMDHGKD